MAKFSTKNYFKKVQTHALLTELYKRHEVTAIFEITEQTARKNVTAIFTDFYNSLDIEKKLEIEEVLEEANGLATIHGEYIIPLLLKQKGHSTITTVECKTKEDLSLYYFLFHKDIFDEAFFIHSFFVKPSYMLYEAKVVAIQDATFALTELTKEFKRILDKEDLGAEFVSDYEELNGQLFYKMSIEGIGKNKRTDEVRIVYLPNDKEVVISTSLSKYEKLLLLDTFLRVVCKDGYLERIESYDLGVFKNESFDFSSFTAGTPFTSWKVKGVTLSLGTKEAKKKIKLTIPSKQEARGLVPLHSFYKELGIEETVKLSNLDSITMSLYFIDQKKKEKSIHVPITLSTNKVSLCPIYPYHAYARKILSQAKIYQGFVEVAKKEKEDVTKKWES